MYAGHDGNVYRNTGSGWQKYDNGSWNSPQKPAAPQGGPQARSSYEHPGSGEQPQRLNQEAQSRERGTQSSERFQQYQHSGGLGGGERFGGGGGGRGGGRR
jgi:hypothetical protein